MNTKRIKSSLYLLVAIVTMAILTAGCFKSKQIGQSIPSEIKPVALETVLNNPSQYNGKKVVLEGIISGQCPSLCEFFYKEKGAAVTVFPKGFKFPKLETGKPVVLYAEITAGPEQTIVSALGLKLK